MAAIDYTTLLIHAGNRVEKLSAGPFTVDGYKNALMLRKEGQDGRECLWVGMGLPEDDAISDGRIIMLDSREERSSRGRWQARELARLMKRMDVSDRRTGKPVDLERFLMRHRDLFEEEKENQRLIIFRTGAETVYWFPYNDAMGGASYGYILSDDGDLSVAVTGYGHYQNPAIHWIGRGLPESAEDEIAKAYWEEMTSTNTFHQLIAGRVFKDKRWNRDGSLELGGFRRDTLTDPDALRLYDRLKEIEEERYRKWREDK